MTQSFSSRRSRSFSGDDNEDALEDSGSPGKSARGSQSAYASFDVTEGPVTKKQSQDAEATQQKRVCPCKWLSLGSYPVSLQKGPASGYPWALQCKCAQLVCLSKEHGLLLFGFGLSVSVFLIDFIVAMEITVLIPILGYIGCLGVLLVQFERVDVIQRLEREVSQLEVESKNVQKHREEMVEHWNKFQQMTDVWVHRTVPRLELLKEVQGALEFAPPEDQLALMAATNDRLEKLEELLPELESWRSDGALSESEKKAFGERIVQVCSNQDNLKMMLQGLSRVIEDSVPQTPPGYSTGKSGGEIHV